RATPGGRRPGAGATRREWHEKYSLVADGAGAVLPSGVHGRSALLLDTHSTLWFFWDDPLLTCVCYSTIGESSDQVREVDIHDDPATGLSPRRPGSAPGARRLPQRSLRANHHPRQAPAGGRRGDGLPRRQRRGGGRYSGGTH